MLEYPTDRLRAARRRGPREVPGRVGLLENLLAHRADPAGVPLLAPLARTAAVHRAAGRARPAPEPRLLDDELVSTSAGRERVRPIRGINDVLRRAAERGALPSEIGGAVGVRRVPRRAGGIVRHRIYPLIPTPGLDRTRTVGSGRRRTGSSIW